MLLKVSALFQASHGRKGTISDVGLDLFDFIEMSSSLFNSSYGGFVGMTEVLSERENIEINSSTSLGDFYFTSVGQSVLKY